MKHDDFTSGQALEMIRGCLSFVFRSKIVRYYGLSGQSAGNIIKRMDNSDDEPTVSFWKAITSGTGKYTFPSDELFKNELRSRDVYLALRSNGCRYLLYTLERHYVNAKGVDDSYPWESSTEHIMPQTLTESWIDYLGEQSSKHSEYVHKLGNLALTDYNSDMSNKDYDCKRKWFLTARYAHTTDLYNIEKWDIDQIDKRGKALADECLRIWMLPKEYQGSPAQVSVGKRRSSFRFSMVGIESGTLITFSRDHNIKATVVDDRSVMYEGEKYSLSGLASKLLGRNDVAGPSYFLYRGRALSDLRTEYEEDQAFDDSV